MEGQARCEDQEVCVRREGHESRAGRLHVLRDVRSVSSRLVPLILSLPLKQHGFDMDAWPMAMTPVPCG